MPSPSDVGSTAVSAVITASNPSAPHLVMDDRLDDREIHLRARRDPRHLGRHLSPMDELTGLSRSAGPGRQALCLVVGTGFIALRETARVGLPP